MRSLFFFLFTFAFLDSVSSQNRFYLRPTIEVKAFISKGGQKPIIPSPYYEYQVERIGLLGGLEIGLLAGYKFNKGRTSIETGLKGENSESGWILSFLRYQGGTNSKFFSYTTGIKVAGGSAGRKIPVLFSTQLKRWDVHIYKPTAFSVNCNLLVGINFYHQYTDSSSLSNFSDTSMVAPTTILYAESSTYTVHSRSVLCQAGFSFELLKKQKEWFMLTLYYMHGFRNLSVEKLDVTLTDINTKVVERYHHDSYGRGSGILLEISKKIFIPKTKKQRQMEQ